MQKVENQKNKDRVSEELKQELEQLIEKSGFNKDIDKDLVAFAALGGGAEAGISDVKINWVLKDSLIPREDFLYALSKIAVLVNGTDYYTSKKIDNPKKHELDHYLSLCDYGIAPGSIFPVNQKFRKYYPIVSPKYLSSIPNIFWDLDIKFPVIRRIFAESTEYSQQTIELDPTLKLTYGMYNCVEDKTLGRINVPCSNNDPDIFHFKLENSDQSNVFQTIDVVRTKNNARILIVLLNGNWVELTNRSSEFDYSESGIEYEWQELAVDNFYSASGIDEMDDFFRSFSRAYIGKKNFLSMEDLAAILKANSNYAKIHNQLTLSKKPVL